MKEQISLEKINAHTIDSNTMNAQLKDLYGSVLSSEGKNRSNHYDMQTDEVHGDYPTNPYFGYPKYQVEKLSIDISMKRGSLVETG